MLSQRWTTLDFSHPDNALDFHITLLLDPNTGNRFLVLAPVDPRDSWHTALIPSYVSQDAMLADIDVLLREVRPR
jgi:hypothetical protein